MKRPPNISDADYIRLLEDALATSVHPCTAARLESDVAAKLLQPLGIIHDPVICGDGFDWVLMTPPYERFLTAKEAVVAVSKRWQCLRDNRLGPGNPHPHAGK